MAGPENYSLTMLDLVNVSNEFVDVCGGDDFREQLPVIVLLVSVLVLGVIGNSLVFFTWAVRHQQSSCCQFILHLALYDIAACLGVIPVALVGLIQRHTLQYNIVCKTYMFLTLLLSLSSLATLDLVAVDRFLKICRPLSFGISYEASRRLFVLQFITGLVFALATLFLQGLGKADSQSTSSYCYRAICLLNNDFYQSEYRLIFNIMMFIVLISMFLVLIVSYLLVIKTLLKRRSGYLRSVPRVTVTKSVQTEEHHLDDTGVKAAESIREEQPGKSLSGSPQTSSVPACSKLETNEVPVDICSQNSSNEDTSNEPCVKHINKPDKRDFHMRTNHRRRVRAIKSAKILSIVTVTFVLCWLPTLLLGTFSRIRSGESLLEQSPEKHKAAVFFEYWYLTSHAANPLIYAFMDHTFRSECTRLLLRVRTLLCCGQLLK